VAPPIYVLASSAFIEGNKVGYLKISYISTIKWKKYIPTLWHYAKLFAGWYIADDDFFRNLPANMKRWSSEQKVVILRGAEGHLHFKYTGGNPKKITVDNIDSIWNDAQKSIKKIFSKQYLEYKEYHCGKPCVDFIRVGNLESYDNDNDKWQRKNIGLALYVYGARWCRETLGLDLRGSGLQSDKAKAAWDKMQQLGWVEPDKTDPKRRIINPDLVK
jgi:hypothetical protein